MLPFNLPSSAGPTVTTASTIAKFSTPEENQQRVGLADLDKAAEYAKQLEKMGISSEDAGFLAVASSMRERESSPQRLQEQLNVLGPYFKDVARENQRLAMEANLFAGFMDIPNKFSRAMAAQHYYMPETMQTIAGNIGRETRFVKRQYVNL
jgi:hypothetical protein